MSTARERAFIQSIKDDIENEAAVANEPADERPFDADEFFRGLSENELFGGDLEISVGE